MKDQVTASPTDASDDAPYGHATPGRTGRYGGVMTKGPAPEGTDSDSGRVTLADIRADMGKNTDPPGDIAAGRTTFYESTEAFLDALDALPYEHDGHFHHSDEEYAACTAARSGE